MSVDAVVYYRVSNATVSVANVENAHHSTRLLAQTTLRNILGTKNLHEILSDRESISFSMQVSARPFMFSGERAETDKSLLLLLPDLVEGGEVRKRPQVQFFLSERARRGDGAVGHQSGAGGDVS